MKTLHFAFAAFLALIMGFDQLAAQIPRTLSYQGVLTDNAGKPRPDGNYTFTFCLFGSNAGGSSIWCETKALPVKNGLFSTALGDKTSFGPAVTFDRQYWLGIQVGNEPELSPRIALTSVGYSFSSLRADTAKIAMTSIPSSSDTTWRASGGNVYRLNGNVGINTTNPATRLEVHNISAAGHLALTADDNPSADLTRIDLDFRVTDTNHTVGRIASFYSNANDGGFGGLRFFTRNSGSLDERLRITEGGNVGINAMNPAARLDVHNAAAAGHLVLTADNNSGADLTRIDLDFRVTDTNHTVGRIASFYSNSSNGGFGGLRFFTRNSGSLDERLRITEGGDIGIGTTSPTSKLEVVGTTTTKVLAITGGGDLAEPFEISENQPIPKGALVTIDEENPGQLKLSRQAYDKRVAGVVSGAGGINPGITLTQEGVLEGGQNVALSGRVYALATAANGPIKPGDLLTTSEVPGHAMKATEVSRSHGTIIGKAMSSLENGEGLVLVLVNLQ